jgi:hypothetical protein
MPSLSGSRHYVSEREMKRVVLNWKSSLFVGNARSGRTAAILASLSQHLPPR